MLIHPEIALPKPKTDEIAATYPAQEVFAVCCQYRTDLEAGQKISSLVLPTRFQNADNFPRQTPAACPESNFYYDFRHSVGDFDEEPEAAAFDEPLEALDDPPAPTSRQEIAIWDRAKKELELEFPTTTFETWIRDTQPISLTDQEIVIGAPFAQAQAWLQGRAQAETEKVIERITGRALKVSFIHRNATDAPDLNRSSAGTATLPLLPAAVVDGNDKPPPSDAHPATEPPSAAQPKGKPLTGPQAADLSEQDAPAPQERASKARLRELLEPLDKQTHNAIVKRLKARVADIKAKRRISPAELERQIEALERSTILEIESNPTAEMDGDAATDDAAPSDAHPATEPPSAAQPKGKPLTGPQPADLPAQDAPAPQERRHRPAPAQAAVFLPAGQHRPQTQTISQGAPQ